MKKRILAVVMLVILAFTAGCAAKPNILKADMQEFSDEALLETINTYTQTCKSYVLQPGQKAYTVSFKTDFDAAGMRISRISAVDTNDAAYELGNYIDLAGIGSREGRNISVNVGWWLQEEGSWVQNHAVWSYLLNVEDANGQSHYYYFRVDYSAFLND